MKGFDKVMAGIRIRRRGGGRPRTRPARVLADKAYTNRSVRTSLRRRGIKAVIPQRDVQIKIRIAALLRFVDGSCVTDCAAALPFKTNCMAHREQEPGRS